VATPPGAPERPLSKFGAEKAVVETYARPPGRRHFWLRRVHSLMGLVFGGYIVTHLVVNMTGLWPTAYQGNVNHIHSLEPMLGVVELSIIFIPLLIHALYGIYITWAGVKFNTTKYAYGGNVRYSLQRWTAVLLLLFIGFHVATMHRWGFHLVYQVTHVKWLQGYATMGLFNASNNQAYQSTMTGIKYFWNYDNAWNIGNVLVMAFYLVGIWSAVFHMANGLWTSAIAWGATTTATAQRRWGHVCLGFGIVMMLVGTMAWYAFTLSPNANNSPENMDRLNNLFTQQETSAAPRAPADGWRVAFAVPAGALRK
jgi:succinate dehydrogenase / fumarate reductase cytochrome b subunit